MAFGLKHKKPDIEPIVRKPAVSSDTLKMTLSSDVVKWSMLAAAVVLLVIGIFIKANYWVTLLLFVVAALIAAYNVFMSAYASILKRRVFDESILVILAVLITFLIGHSADAAAAMILFSAGVFGREIVAQRINSALENQCASGDIDSFLRQPKTKDAKCEKLLKRVSRIATPAAAGAAILMGAVVPLFDNLNFITWVGRAAGIFTIAAAGSTVMAATLTYTAGIAKAAKAGILFKGSAVVDATARATSVIFDKSRTLTTGHFEVTSVQPDVITAEMLLFLAAYAEYYADNKISRAIVKASGVMPDTTRISNFHEIKGRGVIAEISVLKVTAGNLALMSELGLEPVGGRNEEYIIHFAVNGKYAGYIVLNDILRDDAKSTVRELHGVGIDRIAIFTDGQEEAAGEVAGRLGITEYYTESLLGDKIKRLKGLTEMQLPGDKLIYVGDGINDLEVLETADVSVALGGFGVGETVRAANLIIMSKAPLKIVDAVKLARTADATVKQNMWVSFGAKGLFLLLLVFGLFPIWAAIAADAVVAIAVLLNAMRVSDLLSLPTRKVQLRPRVAKSAAEKALIGEADELDDNEII